MLVLTKKICECRFLTKQTVFPHTQTFMIRCNADVTYIDALIFGNIYDQGCPAMLITDVYFRQAIAWNSVHNAVNHRTIWMRPW